MSAPASVEPPPAGPRPLPAGQYVALIAGLILLLVAVGAGAESLGKEFGGGNAVWAGYAVGFVVAVLVVGVFSRLVGNRTAPLMGAILVGMAAGKPAEEVAVRLGLEWKSLLTLPVFFAVYLTWALVVYPRLTGRRPA